MLVGKDRGKTGKVVRVFPESGRLAVEGLNVIKKHRKPRRMGEQGQVTEVPRAVDRSTVALVCPSCKAVTRVAMLMTGEKKTRMCRKCKVPIQ